MGSTVVLVGVAFWDGIFVVDRIPLEGKSVVANETMWVAGGLARPALVFSQYHDTHVVAPVAHDPVGELLCEEMLCHGATLHRVPCEHTPLSLILSGGVDRTCISGKVHFDELTNLDFMGAASVDAIFGDGYNTPVFCEMVARYPQAIASVDVGSLSSRPRGNLRGAAQIAKVVVGHEQKLVDLLGAADLNEACRELLEGETELVAVTNGGESIRVWDGENNDHKIFPLSTNVIDTTGCGDVFHAHLICGLLEGKTHLEAVRNASFHATKFAEKLGNKSIGQTP